MNEKIKVLFLSASPDGLRGDHEIRDMAGEIRGAPFRDSFEVVSEWAVRTRDVQGILQRHKAQIVHFSGHGRAERGIFLEDDFGRASAVSGRAIRAFFEPLRESTKVVILNACETRPLAEELRHVVDYTISMSRPITDLAAITFATQFYSSLAHGLSVVGAFHSAVGQLCTGSTISEADIPDLVVRENVTAAPLVREHEKEREEKREPRDGDVINISGHFRDFNNVRGSK